MNRTSKCMIAAAGLLLVAALPAEAARPGRVPNCGDFRGIARYLQLTAEQLTAARTLGEALRTTIQPLTASIQPLHENLQDLLDVASPNVTSVGTVVVQIDAIRDQIRDAREDYQDDFAALLTPTQLTKYQEILSRCQPD
jgi:Spy/CpxP family protein refolding chaperone